VAVLICSASILIQTRLGRH